MSGAPKNARLTICFLNYWTAGAGASGAGDIDRAVVRSRNGLPYLPAKQLKGHLLESAKRLENNGDSFWAKYRGSVFGDPQGKLQAALRFENAHLCEAEEAALGASGDDTAETRAKKAQLRAGLFVRMASVRIDEKTGAARHRAYRRIEAVVPLTLTALVRCMAPTPDGKIRPAPENWIDRLNDACAITLAAGGLKTDGYGRAVLSLEPLP
jgi:CRISPR-associated protein Csx10